VSTWGDDHPDFIMSRDMLRGVKRRAERLAANKPRFADRDHERWWRDRYAPSTTGTEHATPEEG
jgi:hypothetical protein